MTWLTQIELESFELNEPGRRCFARFDSYAWHTKIWDCFPSSTSQKRDFLIRIDELDGIIRIWILSNRMPICPAWCQQNAFKVKQVPSSFLTYKNYIFDVKANPVIALTQKEDNSANTLRRKNGKHTLSKRIPLTDADDLREWINKKGEQGGFIISDAKPLEIGPTERIYFRKHKNGKSDLGYHSSVVFRGVLEVTDYEKFAHTYCNGIGSAKAFGFGLFLLAPVHI
jgi:CRISPR system Cascade subunit CasE